MSRTVIFHRLAANEARAAEAWYAKRSLEVAARFRESVAAAVSRIAHGAVSHAVGTTRFRYVRLHRFPYRLIFLEVDRTTARVVAVVHDRRRPDYWRHRK